MLGLGLSALALGDAACASDSDGAASSRAEDARAGWREKLHDLPQRVLIGHDTVPLEQVLKKVRPVAVRGTFEAEQGGARASIRLQADMQGLSLVRRFEEPGAAPHEKTYAGLKARAQEGQWLTGPNIEVLGVQSGIAVLETQSGIEGIPGSMWVVYSRARTAAYSR